MSNETAVSTTIQLTDVASGKVASLLAQEGRDDLVLRVAVQPGGCSGLRYQLYFDDKVEDSDTVVAFGTVRVVTDKMSTPYLMGASIDRAGFSAFTQFHETRRQCPEAVPGLDVAAAQEHAVLPHRHGAHHVQRVLVVDLAAVGADGALAVVVGRHAVGGRGAAHAAVLDATGDPHGGAV